MIAKANKRYWTAIVTATTSIAFSACGSEFEDSEIGSSSHALTVAYEFSAVTPSVICNTTSCNVSFLMGVGSESTAVLKYEHIDPEWKYNNAVTPVGEPPGYSSDRPFLWLNPKQGAPPSWETLYNDENLGKIMAGDGNHPGWGGPVSETMAPVGPASASVFVFGEVCAWFRGANNKIQESCMAQAADTRFWTAWEIGNQSYNANMSPMTIVKTGCSDPVALYYGCENPNVPTQVCQLRLHDFAEHSGQFATNFGSGSFHAGTRPTVIHSATYGVWQFAVTVNGSTRKVIALNESAGCSGTPTYTTYTLETQSGSQNYRYSTPMPYVRADGKVAIAYFRTQESPQSNTLIRQQVWSGSSWSSATTIYDVGTVIPQGGGEPVPYLDTSTAKNTILYRLPYEAGVLDVVKIEESSGSWGEPNAFHDGHYIDFNSSTDLRHFDEVTNLPTSHDPIWQVSGGRLYEPTGVYNASGRGSEVIYSDAVIADGYVQVEAESSDSGAQGVIFRYQDPDHYYYFYATEADWSLRRRDGESSTTVLASGTHTLNWSTPHTMRLEAQQSRWRAFIDGVAVTAAAGVTDSVYRSGRAGVYKRDQDNAYFDNFYAVDGGAYQRTIQIKADRDAMLRGGTYDDDNFGATTSWYAKGNSDLNHARKLGVGFSLTQLGTPGTPTVTKASLNLVDYIHSDATSNQNIRVYGVREPENDSWNESTVTWNNFPGNNNTAYLASDSATLLGTIIVEGSQDDGNHGLSLSSQELVDFLNDDTNGRATFLLTAASGYFIGSIATREQGGGCKLASSGQVGDCAPTLDITANP